MTAAMEGQETLGFDIPEQVLLKHENSTSRKVVYVKLPAEGVQEVVNGTLLGVAVCCTVRCTVLHWVAVCCSVCCSV